uniref:Isochorismatase-like domain-containing protein n=1 Tax=Klebsiella pneumoniae TaxID=573 RepID=A0A8B0SUA5_KLEPN|nr:hypothetical protein [Klebsiella pneumoniae]
MSPERRGVLQLGQGADFVEFPVEAFRGDHQRLPARLDEGRGCIGRHLAQVVGVHLTQGLHGCQHALRGRPVLFPNFSLGEEYEHAPPATNRQISPYLPSGRFRTGLPVEGLAIEQGRPFSMHVREPASFYGTALDADLRTRGVSTLVMAGISTTGVVLSSVARASDADYDVRLVGTAATTRIGMPTKLCCVPGSADVYRSCNFRASHDRGHSRRWIGARQGQSKSGCGHRGACNSQKPIAVAEVL